YTEYWSRQINKKDRIIYEVDEQDVKVSIISAKGHYGDK
ncbi:MAG TPA: type II toxin-antitoxin system mRNA interferase toxin, RelE/StbE family, partial [Prolixibacteraceae bacterium]|nr:type II toxin-antitoxin system mRNA interferase toxin, RelE/StbE family [Prolixibacteraceae bacterium]